jgi:hypothetical protein
MWGLTSQLRLASGAMYAVLKYWFGVDKESIHWIIHLHNMAAIHIGGVYPLLLCGLLAGQVFTGMPMTRLWRWAWGGKPAVGMCGPAMLYEQHALLLSVVVIFATVCVYVWPEAGSKPAAFEGPGFMYSSNSAFPNALKLFPATLRCSIPAASFGRRPGRGRGFLREHAAQHAEPRA